MQQCDGFIAGRVGICFQSVTLLSFLGVAVFFWLFVGLRKKYFAIFARHFCATPLRGGMAVCNQHNLPKQTQHLVL